MEHFIDNLLNREYNLNDEILAVEDLFLKRNPFKSMYDVMDENFLSWKKRNNYVDFDTFFEDMGISNIVEKCNYKIPISLDEFLYYCEYMLNMLVFEPVFKHVNSKYIKENICNLLEKLNYQQHRNNGNIHIVEKNVLVSEAADALQDNYELGECIYSFNYREFKGDVYKKADILCRIYKYLESITAKAKEYGYNSLLEDIKDLSNKLDIRHAPKQQQEIVISEMGKEEYESWLDELFKLSLSLIVLVDYRNKRKDIKELKAKLG